MFHTQPERVETVPEAAPHTDVQFFSDRQAVEFSQTDAVVFNAYAEQDKIETVATAIAGPSIRRIDKADTDIAAERVLDAMLVLRDGEASVRTHGADPLGEGIVDAITASPAYPELVANIAGSDFDAINVAQTLVKGVAETVAAELRERARQARRQEDDARNQQAAADAADRLGESNAPDMHEEAEAAQARADAARKEIAAAMRAAAPAMKRAAATIVRREVDNEKKNGELSQAYGDAVGSLTDGQDNEAKRELLREASASPNMRKLLLDAGRLVRDAMSRRESRATSDSGSVVDIGEGEDLSRAMDEEIALLASPATRLLKLLAVADGAVLQYEVEAHEPMRRGPLLVYVDVSGSMGASGPSGMTLSEEASVLAAAIIGVCSRDRRSVRVFPFDTYVRESRLIHSDPNNPASVASAFAKCCRGISGNGGTEFSAVLTHAVANATREEDVVVLTDGCSAANAESEAGFLARRRRDGLTLSAIAVGQNREAALTQAVAAFGSVADSVIACTGFSGADSAEMLAGLGSDIDRPAGAQPGPTVAEKAAAAAKSAKQTQGVPAGV